VPRDMPGCDEPALDQKHEQPREEHNPVGRSESRKRRARRSAGWVIDGRKANREMAIIARAIPVKNHLSTGRFVSSSGAVRKGAVTIAIFVLLMRLTGSRISQY
jgi:hypothetical protein